MGLREQVSQVESQEHLVAFIEALREDLVQNADQWENPSLERFLDAMAAWIGEKDFENFYSGNFGEDFVKLSKWRVFADILYASKIYE